HVPARHEEGIAVVAELAPKLAVDPDPLAHGDLPGELNIAVAELGVPGKRQPCLFEQHRDAFPCNLLGGGVSGSLFHDLPAPGSAILSPSRIKKAAMEFPGVPRSPQRCIQRMRTLRPSITSRSSQKSRIASG